MVLLAVLAAASAGKADLIDINTASATQLAALPGMGPEYVRRVVANRPYTAKNQLVTRGILPAEEYGRIADLVVAHRAVKTSSNE